MEEEPAAPSSEAVPPPAAPLAAAEPAPPPPPPRRVGSAWMLALCVLGGVLAGLWLGNARAGQAAGSPQALATAFRNAELKVSPAVVKIAVETPGRVRRPLLNLPPGLTPPVGVRRNLHSLGSGLIVDPRGYIITNRHVVHRAQRIEVTLPGDANTYFGRLIGEDSETDLALIKIDPHAIPGLAPRPFPTARLGDSSHLAVGDWVVAIGSPFGLDSTVTVGIVSALDRAMDPSQQFEAFIQTDAPINPGNSGGPLVDLAGQVVGINTAIDTYTDGSEGVGFALPSRLVSQVYPQLLRQGHVTRGSLGVYFESLIDPAVRRVYHLEQGVPLSEVAAKGPAATAGLQAGDIITSLNGAPVADGNALMNAIVFFPIGHIVQVGYLRGGVAHRVAVRVADRSQIYPGQADSAAPAQPPPAPLPADLGMDLKDTPLGPQVQSVVPDTFADRIGVHEDDVVQEINHQPVHSRTDVLRLAPGLHPGQDVALVVRRPNGDGTNSRWLLGGTLPPQFASAKGKPGARP